MQNFERRRDRFDLFDRMDSPALNLTFTLDVPDYRPWCKAQGLPPFHVFLNTVLRSTLKLENFRYRVVGDEVIRIDKLWPSFTVINHNHDLNFAQFHWSDDLREFVARSVAARDEAAQMTGMNTTFSTLSAREWKEQVFITCIPWLDFTAIQHPTAALASPDIPSIAWGKYRDGAVGRLQMPFSVQVHHGFVDGYHIHQLARQIAGELEQLIR